MLTRSLLIHIKNISRSYLNRDVLHRLDSIVELIFFKNILSQYNQKLIVYVTTFNYKLPDLQFHSIKEFAPK